MVAIDEDVYLAETIIQLVLMPCIIASNILVIAAPLCWPTLRTVDNILMMNLAVADLITGCIAMPARIAKYNEEFGYIVNADEIPCRITYFFQVIPISVSLLTLSIMCLDKFIAVTFPSYYVTSMNKSKAMLAIGFIWFYRLTLYGIGMSQFNFNSSVVDTQERCSYNYSQWYNTMLGSIIASEMGITAIIATYLLFKVSNIRSHLTPNRKNSLVRYFTDQNKGIKINAFLIYVFIVLWSPTAIIQLLSIDNASGDVQPYYFKTLVWIPLCVNATINAPIYAYVRERNRYAYAYMVRTPPWKWNTLDEVMAREEFRRRFSSRFGNTNPQSYVETGSGTGSVTYKIDETTLQDKEMPKRSSLDIANYMVDYQKEKLTTKATGSKNAK